MTRLYLHELDEETLKKVFDNNEKLRYNVQEDMIESEMTWIAHDYLPCIEKSLSDWSIGAYNHNYINVKDNEEFLKGVLKLQSDYGFLHDRENEFIEEIESNMNKIKELDYDSVEFEELEQEIENDIYMLASKIVNQFNKQFDWISEKENVKNYFLEFYIDERMNMESFYIDENYNLYEEVNYIKAYN